MDPTQQSPQSPQSPSAAPQSTTNGLAIAGFVLSFIFPLLGLILSIVGLTKAKDHNGNGKGLSIAGIVISIISMVLGLVLILTAFGHISQKAEEVAHKTAQNSATQDTTVTGRLELGAVYHEKTGAYSIKLPADWKVTQTEGSRNVDAIPSGASHDYVSSASVSVDKSYSDDTLASLVSSELDALKKYSGATIISEANLTINGTPAHEIVAHEDTGGNLSTGYTVLLIKGASVYRLKYQTSPERGNIYLPVFKQSAQSFVAS